MVTTVTVNPCIDKSISVNGLLVGELNRITVGRIDPCGKGINVAVALHQLGIDVQCTGLNYLENGKLLENRLDECGIPWGFVEVPGSIRTNLKVLDSSNDVMTEFNEYGMPAGEKNLLELMQLLKEMTGDFCRECFTEKTEDFYRGDLPEEKEDFFQKKISEGNGMCSPKSCLGKKGNETDRALSCNRSFSENYQFRKAEKEDLVIIGGSVPKDTPEDYYRKMITGICDFPGRIILDAEKKLLEEGLKAEPYLIKPNLFELESYFGETYGTLQDIVRAARRFLNEGVKIVCVSMGKDGALICNNKEAFAAEGLKIPVRGVQGAGDSMVAGICRSLGEKKEELPELLRSGMAASAASIIRPGTLLCENEKYLEFLNQVQICRIAE